MNRRTLTALAVAAAAVIAVAGCSSSSSDQAATAPTPTATVTSAAGAAAGTIIDVASTTAPLSTLVSAVQAADLVSTLEGTGPFTVFAPTNDAFAALPAEVTDRLLLPCNKDALTKILTYHVVPSKVVAADIKPGDVATVEGQSVTLAVADGVTVNGAKVVTADVQTSNGVVHVIDAVLVPPGLDVSTLKATC